jgi:adenylate cyclase
MTASRRLAAILAADVAGYSRLMGADEETALDYPESSGELQ